MTIFDSPYLNIQYDENLETIIEEWKLDFTKVVAGDNFREPLMTLLKEFKDRKVSKWLCDNTEQKTLESDDQFWLEEFYYAELLNLGLKVAVLVNDKNILGTVNAKNCLQNLREENLKIEVFNKYELAKEWIGNASV